MPIERSNTNIRTETPADHPAVFALVRSAFAEADFSDQTEHLLVERLRTSSAFIPELSLVAEADDRIVGHILLTRIGIQDGNTTHESLALAPVSVHPAFQGQGIGGALIRAAHARARELGFRSVVLVGHADYYPRFGYERADRYGIELPFAVAPENALAVELVTDGLAGVSGRVVYPAAFFTGS